MHMLQLPESMAKAVAMFNILHDQNLTEDQAWHLVTLVDLTVTRESIADPVTEPANVDEPPVETTVASTAPYIEREMVVAPQPVVEPVISHIPDEAWDDPARNGEPVKGGSIDSIPEEAWHHSTAVVETTAADSSMREEEEGVYISDQKWWTATHLFKIHVEPRERGSREHSQYYVHCAERPSQALFNYHYQLFRAGTHRVYVLASNGKTSEDITREFLFSGTPVAKETASVKTSEWEEADAEYRIRFWDTRVGGLNYVYFRNRPSGIVLSRYHSMKQHAVVESRALH